MNRKKIPCEACAYYKGGQTMPVTTEHYHTIREHFVALLGGECAVCSSVFNLEIHHKQPTIKGDNRGRERRMWEWFKSYENKNLSLLCHGCHVKVHKYEF